jgi:hypothetical protein
VLDPDDPVTLRRLSDLRRSQPADATLRNLLGTLNAKLEICARLPVLAYEAEQEGHEQAAATFRELAAEERRALNLLLLSLKDHLDGLTHEMSTEVTR